LKKFNLYITALTLLFSVNFAFSQETLTNIISNAEIQALSKTEPVNSKKQTKIALEIPFVEDFASTKGYPDPEKWIDKNAFINDNYPYNPISVGVATLDAISSDGSMYSIANISVFGADTLTSQQINLNYPGNSSIFLSFFYQPGGLGDTPEKGDMLYVDYYSPDSAEWNLAWRVSYNNINSILTEYYTYNASTKTINEDTIQLSTLFQQVIIPVSEDQYLKSGFQFRIRNSASLSATGNTQLAAGNGDHWNIDFIRLDTARTINDSIIRDICFIKPFGSLLKNYESIPWSHFPRANTSEMIDSIQITYSNLGDTIFNYGSREFEFEDILGNTEIYAFTGSIWDDLEAFQTETYKAKLNYPVPYNPSTDSALFELRSFFYDTDISPSRTQYRWNDTIRYLQKFYNYYSYDDGSAERGYDLAGNGTENGMVAVRFNSYKKDTLRGVQIYFNQSLDNSNEKYFKLCVWNEINGKPGNILYALENIKPFFKDSLNKFSLYIFDTTLVLENNFYVGWQKIYENSLNVGFDVNNIRNDKTFFNFSGTWQNSIYEGTIMIRPMFGKEVTFPTSDKENPISDKLEFSLYPNPASNFITIETDNNSFNQYRYVIFDIYGKSYSNKELSESTIDISGLSSGIYFIRISNTNGQTTTKKFVVIK